MSSSLILLGVLYTSLILYNLTFGFPVRVLHIGIQIFKTLFTVINVPWRIFGIVTIQVIIRIISWMVHTYKSDSVKTIPKKSCPKLKSCRTQTSGAWRKQYIIHQKKFSEQKRKMGHELDKARRSRSRMWRKFKIKASNLTSESEAKTKLMASVKSRVASLALEVDVLVHRIQEKRLVLDKQREDNKAILLRYEHIYQDYHRNYDTVNL